METLKPSEQTYLDLGRRLKLVDFFSNLSVGDLDSVMRHVKLYSFKNGEIIFREGDPADAIYFIYEGKVVVKRKKPFFMRDKILSTLGSGQVFGEMSLLIRKSRTASVVTTQPTKLFVLLASDFDRICEHNPSFKAEMQRIAEQRRYENVHHH